MLALISPAKKMDFESECNVDSYTQPDFLNDTQELVATAISLIFWLGSPAFQVC